MNLFKPALIVLVSSIATSHVFADGWGLGLGVMHEPAPYKDYDYKLQPLPIITYESDGFFLKGIGGGYHLIKNDTHRFSLHAYYMGLQFKPGDTDDKAMKKLDKRHPTMMAGVDYTYTDSWGKIRSSLSADTLSNSNGILAEVAYLYQFKFEKASLTPGVGVIWASSNHNNYYYGISGNEARRSGLKRYEAGDTFAPYLELSGGYAFNKNWSAFFNGRISYLGSDVKDSPMVDQSYSPMFITGVTYSF